MAGRILMRRGRTTKTASAAWNATCSECGRRDGSVRQLELTLRSMAVDNRRLCSACGRRLGYRKPAERRLW